ncbi:Short-chain dehydrogenase [Nonomuraea solani]|uniref:Short-chain dehydrogenase n=1 Tax=Nonomuraea solani TaxID=1144553 RepID=A0A1H6DFG6_9ACTN|nr:SDR family NAD(P)-dependent oxidoreductase [Nonomuraea solani]SEG83316.1 Short-chain dehydrogenase [Nonomuraea solani]
MTEKTTALVTGANKGIGYEVAAGLAARGMTVLLACRDRNRGEQAATRLRTEAVARPRATEEDRLRAEAADRSRATEADWPRVTNADRLGVTGVDVRPIVLDVTDPASIEAAIAPLTRLDVLVNNAGVSGPTGEPPSATSAATVREVFETNVFGVLMLTNAVLPLLRRSPMARIVNVSSGVGSMAHHSDPGHYMSALPPSAVYPPSKAALNALTVQYAKELRKDGILVNAATPGACATDFTKDLPFAITRTAAQGAAIIIELATLDAGGPTGGFFDELGTVPW